jgi:hypothetical protein
LTTAVLEQRYIRVTLMADLEASLLAADLGPHGAQLASAAAHGLIFSPQAIDLQIWWLTLPAALFSL